MLSASRLPTSAPTRATLPGRAGHTIAVGLLAALAWWGTIGLITGTMSFGHQLDQRLPLHSPVLGGVALGLAVALPATVTAALAACAAPDADRATFLLGLVVVGWIVVELAFLRHVSFLHPVVAGYGIALALWKGRTGRQVIR